MYLIVGLGNPGAEYQRTRHNIGFMFLDYLAERHQLTFATSKWKAEVVKGRMFGETVVLVKPQTFMNLSGTAVAAVVGFYRIPVENVLVVHDELDLELGRVKMVVDRGPGGHNGVRSLIEHLGGKNFVRLRVGIGRPPGQAGAASYVLSRFTADELAALEQDFRQLEEGVEAFLLKGAAAAMNLVNRTEGGAEPGPWPARRPGC